MKTKHFVFSLEEVAILKSLVENEIIEVSNSINDGGYTDWNGCFRCYSEERKADLVQDHAELVELASKLDTRE